MRAFSTDKQMQGLSHLRFVSFTVDQMFLAQIIIHEFLIHVMFYVSHMIRNVFWRNLPISVLIVQV